MDEVHRSRVVAWWAAGRTGIAKTASAPNVIHFTSPPAFGGVDGRWTPEDLLLCAIAGCYTTTFHAIAENSTFEYRDLQVEAEGEVRRADSGYTFTEIILHVNLLISQHEEQSRGMKLLRRVADLCLVSRAISAPLRFDLHVQGPDANPDRHHAVSAFEK